MSYYVTIKDYYGHKITVKVSFEIRQVYDEAKKAKERERYERRKHLDRRPLDDLLHSCQAASETLEEVYFHRAQLRALFEVLRECTPVQRRRFYLNRICGCSYFEIAGIEGCSKRAVEKSIKSISKKFTNLVWYRVDD
jgi:RNA polymerase sigma-70 factor (ECF subfamily)